MFRFKGQFQLPSFMMARYKQEIAKQLDDIIARAAFEWLNAVVDQIPVWSGASRATFLHLALEIGYPIQITGGSGPDRVRMGLVASYGNISNIPGRTWSAMFEYATRLKHLIYNEYNNANVNPDEDLFAQLRNPGPYNFQDKGEKAVKPIIDGFSLPDPRVYIKVKHLRLGRR